MLMKTKSLFAAFMLLFSATSMWASDTSVDGIWYDFYSSTMTASVTYSGSGYYEFDRYSGTVVIPSSVVYKGKTYNVKYIGFAAFAGCTGLTTVSIPSSVTSIDEGAFESCSGLKSVDISDLSAWCKITFASGSSNPLVYAHNLHLNGEQITELVVPNDVISIGNYALYGCSGLTSVTIGSSVTSIGNDAFSGCSGLTSVTIGNSVTSIGNYAFYGCSGLTSVTIPNSITSIGNYAFEGCNSLTSVTIGNSVTSIGNYAFEGCNSLTSVTIGNSVTSIGNYAFEYCSSLTSVTIPNSVNSIGNYAFRFCYSLTSVIIGNSVTSIGNMAFSYCNLTNVTIPYSVASIGEEAFAGCNKMTSIIWNAKNNSSPSQIDKTPFYDIRTKIKSFVLGSVVESIPAYLCYGMEQLTSLSIPNSVTSIGESAFAGCTMVQHLTIGEGVTTIDASAFANCPYLIEVKAKMKLPPVIEASVFTGCGDLSGITCYVPEGSLAYYQKLDVWKEFNLAEKDFSEEDAIETTNNDAAVSIRKELRDGQLFILREGKMYTIQGQEVR